MVLLQYMSNNMKLCKDVPAQSPTLSAAAMEWPQDIIENIWSHVRRSVHPRLKRRQCDLLRDELMQKWFDLVLKPFVEDGCPELQQKHPEGNFMDSYESIECSLMLCLLAHWNIKLSALNCIDDDVLQWIIISKQMNDYINDFYEDWEKVLPIFCVEEWPNCVQNMKCVLSCPCLRPRTWVD
jgi:hypothetical protein